MDLGALINKTVACRFAGAETRIALSHGLFSSYDIDSGTRLLLKALAAQAGLAEVSTLADIGCGTGVLGIAAAKAFPGLKACSRDRDALALAFTAMNAKANGLGDRLAAEPGLLLDYGSDRRFDRIVSNLPAKAGKEALADFFLRAPSFLSPGGSAWVVIVNSLAVFAQSSIALSGHELVHREEGKEHTVFGFRGAAGTAAPAGAQRDPLEPYLRGSFPFSLGGSDYEILTARDIPDFDTPGYGLSLCAKFLDSRFCADFPESSSKGLLVWNPGQGHVPLLCARRFGHRRFVLAGRDFLELRLSARNLSSAFPDARMELVHAADPAMLGELLPAASLGAIIAFPDLVPGYPWSLSLFESARSILAPGGLLLAQSTSSALSCLDKKRPAGFSQAGDKREKAFRIAQYRLL
jgi:16S rRNA G1207 methylase RsmC